MPKTDFVELNEKNQSIANKTNFVKLNEKNQSIANEITARRQALSAKRSETIEILINAENMLAETNSELNELSKLADNMVDLFSNNRYTINREMSENDAIRMKIRKIIGEE